jgi:hypothetical protein
MINKFHKIGDHVNFYLFILRDAFGIFPLTLVSISGIKVIRLVLTSFVLIQFIAYYNKFYVLNDFNLKISDYLVFIFIFAIFPIFMTGEVHLHISRAL